MAGTYDVIKDAVLKKMDGLIPSVNDMYTEEISNLQDDGETRNENYIFIDIVDTGTITRSSVHTDRNWLIDIAVHTEKESKAEYHSFADKIDKVIRPVFTFEDRAITVHNATTRIIDRVLHYNFTLSFTDETTEEITAPLMGELKLNI